MKLIRRKWVNVNKQGSIYYRTHPYKERTRIQTIIRWPVFAIHYIRIFKQTICTMENALEDFCLLVERFQKTDSVVFPCVLFLLTSWIKLYTLIFHKNSRYTPGWRDALCEYGVLPKSTTKTPAKVQIQIFWYTVDTSALTMTETEGMSLL